MDSKAEQFFAALKTSVENDDLVLPTLPEVAFKIRAAVEDEDSTAQKVADVIVQDASLSVRLMQAANSPMYGCRTPAGDVQTAVMRLGSRLVRDMVVRLAMKQMFQATSDALDTHFRRVWNTAVEVAAISRMLATMAKGMNPEQALLAGLVHNIGSLPILVLAENDDELFQDEKALGELMFELQEPVGEMILRSWNFSDELTDVVRNVHNFSQNHDGSATLIDVVQVSLLQGNFIEDEHLPADMTAVPAFSQLSMDSEVNVVEVEENQEAINNTREALQI